MQYASIDQLMTRDVPIDVIAAGLDKVYEFHLRAAALTSKTVSYSDLGAATLIERAIIAEVEDPEPLDDPWPCLDHNNDGTPRAWPGSQDLPTVDPKDGGRNDR